MGLNINMAKTKVMSLTGKNYIKKETFLCAGIILEEIEKYCYLGSIIERNVSSEADVKRRVEIARKLLNKLKKM